MKTKIVSLLDMFLIGEKINGEKNLSNEKIVSQLVNIARGKLSELLKLMTN